MLLKSNYKHPRIINQFAHLSILSASVALYCGGVNRTKALGSNGSCNGRRTPSLRIPSARPEQPPVYPINGILNGLDSICFMRSSLKIRIPELMASENQGWKMCRHGKQVSYLHVLRLQHENRSVAWAKMVLFPECVEV